MANIPEPLQQILEDFAWITDRTERSEYLIQFADQYEPVPTTVAVQPYPAENHVDYCESDAYVWAVPNEDGTLKFHFAVENPQGLSAKAIAAILDQTLSNQPLAQVAAVSDEIVFDIFGKQIAMGKGQGLMGLVAKVRMEAKRHLTP